MASIPSFTFFHCYLLVVPSLVGLLFPPTGGKGLTGSAFITSQLFPARVHSLSGCTPPLCVCHFVLSLPVTSSIQVPSATVQTFFGKEWSHLPDSLPRILQRTWWTPGLVGHSHPGPRDLIVLKHSPYHLILQCPLQFLVSYLPICWDTTGCSLCSPEDRLGVSPVCRGKWNVFPPILPPSSKHS